MCERIVNRISDVEVANLATRAAKPHCLSWKGVAERSESFKIMIAGGNHSTVERCRTNVRRRGLFVN